MQSVGCFKIKAMQRYSLTICTLLQQTSIASWLIPIQFINVKPERNYLLVPWCMGPVFSPRNLPLSIPESVSIFMCTKNYSIHYIAVCVCLYAGCKMHGHAILMQESNSYRLCLCLCITFDCRICLAHTDWISNVSLQIMD